MNANMIWSLLKETYKEWRTDEVPRLAAALSYYTAIAIAPLLVFLVTAIGWFYGNDSAQVQLVGQLQATVGPQAAEVVEAVIESADRPNLATFAGIISFLTLLWGASNLFVELQDALNIIWGVKLKRGSGFMNTIKERYLSFGMLLMIAFALLVSLILSAVFSALSASVRDMLPGADIIWQIVDFVISFAIITLLFGLIYKVLPAVEIAWRDVWMGAAATALLFTIGKWLLGIYLGYSSSSSAYGAAGSLLVFLIWVYYSAQICLFGAEFTQVYATRLGHGVRPDKDAVPRDDSTGDSSGDSTGNASGGKGGDTRTLKPAAMAVMRDYNSQVVQRQAGDSAPVNPPAALSLAALPFGELLSGLLDDWYRLFRQEIHLAQVEFQEALQRAARGAALIAGGGVVLNTSVLFLLTATIGLIYAVTTMPLWLATLLIGLLALIEGGLLILSALRSLKRLKPLPTQSLQMVREDAKMVKEHLAT